MSYREVITLGSGSGGRRTRRLIQERIVSKLGNQYLATLDDAVYLTPERLMFTSDSFTVDPIFFPGGDIGKLAVCGSVNDLAVTAAVPVYLSLNFIISEGLPFSDFERIIQSISKAAKKAQVCVVCGDFKVIPKQAEDMIFVAVSGIGRPIKKAKRSIGRIKPGDKIIINGGIAEHGIAVMLAREKMFEFTIKSDCTYLCDLLTPLWQECPGVRFARDPTRGGITSCLYEIKETTGYGIVLYEEALPVHPQVDAACQLLGLDPLYIANEGKVLLVVESGSAHDVMRRLRKHQKGRKAAIIGEMTADSAHVVLRTKTSGTRIIADHLDIPLPRIC